MLEIFGANDDAQEWEVQPAVVYRTDLENLIQGAIDAAEALMRADAGYATVKVRELALVRTKLDEAQLWLTRVDREGGEA